MDSPRLLTNVTLCYALEIANKGYLRAIKENKALALGVNVIDGKLTCEAVAESLNLEYTPLESPLAKRCSNNSKLISELFLPHGLMAFDSDTRIALLVGLLWFAVLIA